MIIRCMFVIVLSMLLLSETRAQITCNPQGNVVLYSNYDGGVLNINVDVNIPNLKIGIVSYEMVTINLTGAFVNNITEVRFAGYTTTTHHHCNNSPAVTSITGAPLGTDTIIFMPSSPVNNPNGYYIIICNYTCDTNNNQGGCNTADQVAAYFLQSFGGTLRYHFTQYGCWNGTYNISDGGNCCVGSVLPSQLPVASFEVSDTSFCEKQCVDFSDLSSNNPTSWQWTFSGAVPSSSSLQNPSNICYNNYGSFDVSLIACNANGCDTINYAGFINEYPNPYDSIWNINDTLYSLPAYNYQWYEVTNGMIAGANDSLYIPIQPGDYYCVITDSTGCIGTSNTINVIGAGINDLVTGNLFSVHPNPSNGWFLIELNNPAIVKKWSAQLFDAFGRNVFSSEIIDDNSYHLNLKFLMQGFYYLKISQGSVFQTQKLIIL